MNNIRVVISIVMLGILATGMWGCASMKNWGKGGIVWEEYKEIRPNHPDELTSKFIDLSGRADAQQILQKQEYTKFGKLSYSFMLTPFTSTKEKKWQEMIEEAKSKGADAVRQVRDTGDDWEKDLRMELMRYWK